MNNENNSNRVYGNPDKYIDVTSRPVLSEEEQRKQEHRESIAMRQQRIEQKTSDYINLIDQNHGIRGEHAGTYKVPEINQTEEEQRRCEIRFAARTRLEERIRNNDEIRKQAQKLKIKGTLTRIIAASLIVCASMAGIVGAYKAYEESLEQQPSLEQNDPIIPTEEELGAGLTEQQIMEKRALDEQINAETLENLGIQQETHGRTM